MGLGVSRLEKGWVFLQPAPVLLVPLTPLVLV